MADVKKYENNILTTYELSVQESFELLLQWFADTSYCDAASSASSEEHISYEWLEKSYSPDGIKEHCRCTQEKAMKFYAFVRGHHCGHELVAYTDQTLDESDQLF